MKSHIFGKNVYTLAKLGAGRYEVKLEGVGNVGEVMGRAGNWTAFYRGKQLTNYNKIGDAVRGIDNDHKRTQR